MCGIAAILKTFEVPCPAVVLDRMRDEVSHRGPDDHGNLFFRRFGPGYTQLEPSSSAWEAGLGHRRLSILDLGARGHQPMVYRDRFWIVYNGEVYNFVELRSELERLGHKFFSSSDTEVILAAYAEWGPASFARFRGMWGLVILDSLRAEVIVSRDRLGIKPVYFWKGPRVVAIASEIKQFRHVPGFEARMDFRTADEYIRTGYEDSKRTFFRDVLPVQAGTWFSIPLDTLDLSHAEEYWYPERVQVSVTDREEAGLLFGDKLRECVRMHLRSDVPVGCALSGGLDSSSIAVIVDALQDSQSPLLNTFTLAVPGEPIDEQDYADAVVASLRRPSPHVVSLHPEVFLKDLDRFLWIHDEPVGSLSMYAGYCIARLTRQAGVPVTLNGQGGDEILSAYWQCYFLYLRDLWRQGRLLSLASHFAGALLGDGNPTLVGQIPMMLRRYRARSKPSIWLSGCHAVRNTTSPLSEILALDGQARRTYEVRSMFLPRLLKWDDRNFMAFSVEGRYPLLDHELIELCLSFAPQALYKRGWTKQPIRLGLKNELPRKILHRRSKFGFEAPQDKWLCGALRPVLENWLASDRPVWQYTERADVRRLAEQTWQLNGEQDELGQALFRVFIFDKWLEIFGINS